LGHIDTTKFYLKSNHPQLQALPVNGVKPTDELKTALVKLVRSEIGAIATVDKIQFAPNLPKHLISDPKYLSTE
jgi:acyl-coenzyme A synthetase/AMP-(fatty) acid ligase